MKLVYKLSFLLFIFFAHHLYSEQYDLAIKYLGISVVNVKISDSNNKLTVKAKATSIASIAAKMDNLYSIEYIDNYLPIMYAKKINQKDYFEDRITTYDRINLKANRTSFLDAGKDCEYNIVDPIRDFFSSLLYLRNAIDDEQGEIWLDANKLLWKAKYEVMEKETIKCILGKLRTIKVKIDFINVSGGEKERSDMLTNNLVNEERSLYFWFSDDERRIPVKAKFVMKPFPVTWKLKNYKE